MSEPTRLPELALPLGPGHTPARPAPPVVAFGALDRLPLAVASGANGHTETVLGCVMEALRAGGLRVEGPGLPGALGRVGVRAVRLYRWSGPAWHSYREEEKWCGRGEWYATAYVPRSTRPGRMRRGTANVYVGKWHTPGTDARPAANANRDAPSPLSVAGVRRTVARIEAKVEGRAMQE